MGEWVKRWGYEIAKSPTKTGAYRLKTGGYLTRSRVLDPRTGKRHQVMMVHHRASLRDALSAHERAVQEVRDMKASATPNRMRFSDYAVSLLESKVLRNEIESKATRERWDNTLRHYLIPAFGSFWVSELRRQDVEEWKDRVARWMKGGVINPKTKRKYYPKATTVNGWLRILKTICEAARIKFDLHRSACDGIEFFPEGRAYTAEDPNSVAVGRLSEFMRLARELAPDHYPMILLGLCTGLRPSSMRPLRKSGPNADIDWSTGRLEVRRSHSRTGEIMEKTKTKIDLTFYLPPELVEILRAHANSPHRLERESEYLFPNANGGLRSRTVLQKPFAKIKAAMGLARLTPRSMRRTFQDAARTTGTSDKVTRSISGHATEGMQIHYSTIQQEEQKDAISRVLQLAGAQTEGVKRGVTK